MKRLIFSLFVLCLVSCINTSGDGNSIKPSADSTTVDADSVIVEKTEVVKTVVRTVYPDPDDLYDVDELRDALVDAYDKIHELEDKIENVQMLIDDARDKIRVAQMNIDDARMLHDRMLLDDAEIDLSGADDDLDDAELELW